MPVSTNASVGRALTTTAKSLTVSETALVNKTKFLTRAVIEPSDAKIIRSRIFTGSTTQASTAKLVRLTILIRILVLTPVVTISKSLTFSKILTTTQAVQHAVFTSVLNATQATVATLSTIKISNRTLSVGQGQNTTITRFISKIITTGANIPLPPVFVSTLAIPVLTTIKQRGFSFTTTVAESATLKRTAGKNLVTSITESALLSRVVGKVLTTVAVTAPVLNTIRGIFVRVSQSQVATAIHQYINTKVATQATSAVVQKLPSKNFSTFVLELPSIIGSKVAKISNLTTTQGQSSIVSKSAIKVLVTTNSMIAVLTNTTQKVLGTATVGSAATLSRMTNAIKLAISPLSVKMIRDYTVFPLIATQTTIARVNRNLTKTVRVVATPVAKIINTVFRGVGVAGTVILHSFEASSIVMKSREYIRVILKNVFH